MEKSRGNFLMNLEGLFLNGYLNGMSKEDLRRNIISTSESYTFDVTLSNRVLDEVVNGFKELHYGVVDVKAKVKYRLISGVASGFFKTVFEVGLNYDPILDVPYIPGSTVKGVLKSNAIELCGRDFDCITNVLKLFGVSEGEAVDNFDRSKDYYLINFGRRPRFDEGSEGLIIVSDSYPVSGGKLLEGDVINPHYTDPNKTEYDIQPIPIIFLSVRGDVVFRFIVGVKKKSADPIAKSLGKALFNIDGVDATSLMFMLLSYSLMTGVGAKTSRGYSVFDIVEYKVA